MLNRKYLFCVPFLLGLLSASSITAQAPSAWDSSRQAMQAAIIRLKPGATIRLHTQDGGNQVGQFAGSTDSTVMLRGESAPVSIPTIDSIWVRGRSGGTGMWVGAILGAVLIGTAAKSINAALCEYNCASPRGAFALGAVVGAGGGMLLGYVVGSAFPKWKRRLPT